MGIISSRTAFFKRDSSDWREQVVLRYYRPLALADLGYFVLDAKVGNSAYVLRSLRTDERENIAFSFVAHITSLVEQAGSHVQRCEIPRASKPQATPGRVRIELLSRKGV